MNDIRVSCIMPTTSRRKQFLPWAIRGFLQQDYRYAELIIVDDSDGSLEFLVPPSEKITYIHTSKFSSLGAKRNYACSMASGDIIMHLDDDDWYAPDWISHQVNVLKNHEADICGLDQVKFYSPVDQKCWEYTYGYDNRNWVAGATLAYKRSAWVTHPFQDLQVGEDNQFVWNSPLKVVAHDYHNGFVSVLHEGNTSLKTQDRQWKVIPVSVIEVILCKDVSRYHQLHMKFQ